jgi:hypothetical protein
MSSPLGITLSTSHLHHLGIPLDFAITEALKYNFSHIRLGAYWNQIETSPGKYNFTELTTLLTRFEKAHQPIVLALGVKAPRWPEYYWPDWVNEKNPENPETQKHILSFIEKVIHHTRKFSCITHWQIENEPFDPSGPEKLSISPDFLHQEINLVKKLDPRPTIITLWGNNFLKRKFFSTAEKLGDIVGLDLYPKQFLFQALRKSFYSGIQYQGQKLHHTLSSSTKPVWIMELQAEPWEKDEEGYKSANPGSISPEQLHHNIVNAQKLPVTRILLWGFEYWLWKAKQGDSRYLDEIKRWI